MTYSSSDNGRQAADAHQHRSKQQTPGPACSPSRAISLDRFIPLISGLASTTQKRFSEDDITFWHKCFRDIPADVVEAAFTKFVLSGDEWPTVSKIRTLAAESIHGAGITAGEAFERASKAVRCIGFCDGDGGLAKINEAKSKLDALTWGAIQALGGWPAFCESPSNERSTLRAQFRMAYDAVQTRQRKHLALPENLRPRIANPKSKPVAAAPKRRALPGQSAAGVADSLKLPEGAES